MDRLDPTGRGLAPLLAVALALTLGCQRAAPRAAPGPSDAASETARAAPAAAQVPPEERGVAHAEELLAGRFAGVDVLRLPSGAISVRVRGGSSVLGSSEPLYVLDGMPLTPGPGGALHGINPADIVRIEVLKDIGSTSLYGMRGANGVVLITTRRPPRPEDPGG